MGSRQIAGSGANDAKAIAHELSMTTGTAYVTRIARLCAQAIDRRVPARA